MKPLKESTSSFIFDNLSVEQKVSIGATVAACFIDLVVFWIGHASGDLTGFYISLVLTTTAAVIADRVAGFYFENRFMNELRSFNPTKHDLHEYGDGEKGLDWFCQNYSGLVAVRNTVFRDRLGSIGNIYGRLEEFNSVARKVIGPTCAWHDLIVQDTANEILAFHSTLADVQKPLHHIYKLKHEIPLIQMLVLDYRSGDRVVLLGWGYHSDKQSKVYVSTDRETATYFRDYFDHLKDNYANPIRPVPNTAADEAFTP